jgi:hypothetical protein
MHAMRSGSLAAVLAALLSGSPAVGAGAEDGYRHGRVRFVESGVTLHRATEVSAEEALANLPLLPGDRVWSDASGRAEFQFPDGTLVRLDARSKLDYAGHEEGRDERIVLRLWSGSLIVRVRTRDASRFEVETPAGSIELEDQAMVRVDVDAGQTRVSVYRGGATLDDGRGRVRLAAGERVFARWGEPAGEAQAFDIGEGDDFARWDELRESEERWAARSSEYLPAELDPYAGELERNGSWRYEASVGYVWAPRVAASWSPYTYGHWSWTPYGWTWVPYEAWGWAPFHYGRWGFSVSFGWYWAPGRAWGPGWVSWGIGGGYVGWCPLGYRDRPVHPWGGHNRGYAVPRHGGRGGWNVVREGDFGHRDIARRRVPLAGVAQGALQVAESPNHRPTRDARALQAANPSARAISRRPTPGDFVRELAVDNKTTIPSPWLRRGRATNAGGGERSERRSTDTEGVTPRERGTAGGEVRGWERHRPTQRQPADTGARERSAGGARAPRTLPWFAPRDAEARRDDASAPEAAAPGLRSVRPYHRDTEAGRRARRPQDEARTLRLWPERQEAAPRREEAARPRPSFAPRREEGGSRPESRSYRQESGSRRPEGGGFVQQTRPAEPAPRQHRQPEPSSPRAESASRPSRPSRGEGGGWTGGARQAPRPQRERQQ